MSSSPRDLKFWASAWLPVLIGIGVIIAESTAYFGADHTSGPLRLIFQALFGPVSDVRWDLIHHAIRKSGHFIGYGLISLAWLRAWWMTFPELRFFYAAVDGLFCTALLATWDEWHQSFLPNRGSSPWDVLLDCCGASAMILLTYLCLRIVRRRRLERAA
jgi:VanZ family protein